MRYFPEKLEKKKRDQKEVKNLGNELENTKIAQGNPKNLCKYILKSMIIDQVSKYAHKSMSEM